MYVNIDAGFATIVPPQFKDKQGKLLSWEEVKDIREKNGFPSVECPEMLLPPNMRMPPVLESSQPQSLSKYEEMARRKEKKEKRKSKNVLTEFNSDEVPGHKFEDVDTVLQSLGIGEEETKKKTKKKKKKKNTVEVVGGDDVDEEETERPWSSCSQATDTEQEKEEVGKLSFEVEREYWWAQAGHIQGLTQAARVARAQKEQAEDIEVKNMRESFMLAEAMGVSIPEGANPYNRPAKEKGESSSETVQLAQFLEESIKKKEKHLECPVCLEVATKEPIFGCSRQFHLICASCCKTKPGIEECPQCRVKYGRQGPVRNRFAEREAEELKGLIAKLDQINFS